MSRRSGRSRPAGSRRRSTPCSASRRSPRIEEAEAASRSEVQELFVQSMGSESASVFAVVGEELTNRSLEEPQPGVIRLEVELLKTGSGWKVEGVQLFQSPGED